MAKKQYFIMSLAHRSDIASNDKQDFTFTGAKDALVTYYAECKRIAGLTNASSGVVTMWDENHNVLQHEDIIIPAASASAAEAQGKTD